MWRTWVVSVTNEIVKVSEDLDVCRVIWDVVHLKYFSVPFGLLYHFNSPEAPRARYLDISRNNIATRHKKGLKHNLSLCLQQRS